MRTMIMSVVNAEDGLAVLAMLVRASPALPLAFLTKSLMRFHWLALASSMHSAPSPPLAARRMRIPAAV